MGQVAPPTMPAHGAANWDTQVNAALEALRQGHNTTDSVAAGAATTAGSAATTAGSAATVAAQAGTKADQALAVTARIIGVALIAFDTTANAWPALPTGWTGMVIWFSGNSSTAPRPPQMGVGHHWADHPDSTVN